MKITIERNWIDVLGEIWMPYGAKCAQKKSLTAYDLENIGEPTRENVEHWLSLHDGDFSRILDFHAIVGDVEIPWGDEENEMAFWDCMDPQED